MVGMFLQARGWGALILIAMLIAAGELLRGVRLLSKILFSLAALVAVMAAVGEWKR